MSYLSLLTDAAPVAGFPAVQSDWTGYGSAAKDPIERIVGVDVDPWVLSGSGCYLSSVASLGIPFDAPKPYFTSVELVLRVDSLANTNYLCSTSRTTNALGSAVVRITSDGKLQLYHIDRTTAPYARIFEFSETLDVNTTYLISASLSRANKAILQCNGIKNIFMDDMPNTSGAFMTWDAGRIHNYSYGDGYSAGFRLASVSIFNREISFAEHVARYSELAATYEIGNNFTVSGGGPGDYVAIIDATTKELVELIEPDTNGDWTAHVPEGEYYALYFGDGCQPSCHGPYTITAT